jgi:capsular exopolysaccharide synthesis family protein
MSLEAQSEFQPGPKGLEQPTSIHLEGSKMSLMDVWLTLLKQRYTILTVTLIMIAGAAFYAYRTPPLYESVSRIEIKPNQAPNVGLQNLLDEEHGDGAESTQLATELHVLQSDSVLFQTAQALNLQSRIFAANNKSATNAANGDIQPRLYMAMIKYLRKSLNVAQLQGTQVIEIRYRNTDPQLATDVANKLVETYADVDLHSKFERTIHVSGWLEKQLEDLQRQASDAQQHLADYQKEHNIVGADENSNLTMQTLGQISADLENAEADRITKEARLREFSKMPPDMTALMGDNPALSNLRNQLTDLQTQRTQLAVKYGENYPRMRDLKIQIEKVQSNFNREVEIAQRQVQKEYQGSLALEQSLRQRLEVQEEAAYKLNEDEAQYSLLRHEAELNRDLYDTLQMRLKEAGVMAGLSAANISVIDRAHVPVSPVAPRKGEIVLFGALGGLLIGCIIAFVIESIDDRLQTSEEVESVSALPSLATIPHIADDAGKHRRDSGAVPASSSSNLLELTALRSPKSAATEAYRGLRSSLLLSSIDKPPQLIVLTSAFPGEGKTTTAVNCALVLAQRGEKVLLVDADLRRGSLGRVFNMLNASFGLSTLLSQADEHSGIPAPLDDLLTLHVLPAGPRPPNPAEMLSSKRMQEQLKLWRKEYDRIVIDTAPVLAVSDTQAVAAMADAVVLVARAGITRRRALIRARDLLWRVNVKITGVVVNDVDMRLENF